MSGLSSSLRPLVGASAAVLALALGACGSDTNGADAGDGLPAEAKEAKASLGLGDPSPDLCKGKQYTIGYDSFSDSQPFAVSVAKNLDEAAAKMGCVKLVKLVDNLDPQTALANVKTLIQQKVDGVILFQVLADAQPGIARALEQAGIPAVATAVPAPGVPFISANDRGAGEQAGKALGEAFVDKHQDGEMPYLIVGGRPAGGPVDKQRADGIIAGVKSVIPDLPDANVQVIDSKAVQDESYARTLDALSRVPAGKPVLIGGENEEVVAGMYRAAKQRKRDDLLVAGLGGDETGMKLVCTETDHYVGTVQFAPEKWGDWLLPAMIAEIQKAGLPDTVYIPTTVQTKADIQKAYPDVPCA